MTLQQERLTYNLTSSYANCVYTEIMGGSIDEFLYTDKIFLKYLKEIDRYKNHDGVYTSPQTLMKYILDAHFKTDPVYESKNTNDYLYCYQQTVYGIEDEIRILENKKKLYGGDLRHLVLSDKDFEITLEQWIILEEKSEELLAEAIEKYGTLDLEYH